MDRSNDLAVPLSQNHPRESRNSSVSRCPCHLSPPFTSLGPKNQEEPSLRLPRVASSGGKPDARRFAPSDNEWVSPVDRKDTGRRRMPKGRAVGFDVRDSRSCNRAQTTRLPFRRFSSWFLSGSDWARPVSRPSPLVVGSCSWQQGVLQDLLQPIAAVLPQPDRPLRRQRLPPRQGKPRPASTDWSQGHPSLFVCGNLVHDFASLRPDSV